MKILVKCLALYFIGLFFVFSIIWGYSNASNNYNIVDNQKYVNKYAINNF